MKRRRRDKRDKARKGGDHIVEGGGHIHLPVFPLRCPDRRGKNQGGGGEKYRAPPLSPPPPRLFLWEVGKSLPLSTTAETDFFLRFSTVPSPPSPSFPLAKGQGKSFFSSGKRREGARREERDRVTPQSGGKKKKTG